MWQRSFGNKSKPFSEIPSHTMGFSCRSVGRYFLNISVILVSSKYNEIIRFSVLLNLRPVQLQSSHLDSQKNQDLSFKTRSPTVDATKQTDSQSTEISSTFISFSFPMPQQPPSSLLLGHKFPDKYKLQPALGRSWHFKDREKACSLCIFCWRGEAVQATSLLGCRRKAKTTHGQMLQGQEEPSTRSVDHCILSQCHSSGT